jgi:hypothetical protein
VTEQRASATFWGHRKGGDFITFRFVVNPDVARCGSLDTKPGRGRKRRDAQEEAHGEKNGMATKLFVLAWIIEWAVKRLPPG